MLALRDMVLAAERDQLRLAREVLGVGVTEMLACGYLSAEGARTPSEIAEQLDITTASVTELLDRMERGGLVRRDRHPDDRRKLLVELTEAGQRQACVMQRRSADVMAACGSTLSADQRELVLGFLRAAATALRTPSSPGRRPCR